MSDNTPDNGDIEGEKYRPLHERPDRERGMLTRTDRELLLNLKEYDSEQALRNARYRVREHVRNSLHDIFLAANYLNQEDLEQLIERQQEIDEEADYPAVVLPAGPFTLGCRLSYIEAMNDQRRTFETVLEGHITHSIRSAVALAEDDKIISDINVEVSIETKQDSEALVEELISGNPRLATVTSYLEKHDAELLRETLRERGEVIDLAGDSTMGPNHDLFDMFSKADSGSS